MMSISPHMGHFSLTPKVQKAGHMPSRGLNLARISNRPYSQENLLRVVREAEVYSASFRVVCQFFPPDRNGGWHVFPSCLQ